MQFKPAPPHSGMHPETCDFIGMSDAVFCGTILRSIAVDVLGIVGGMMPTRMLETGYFIHKDSHGVWRWQFVVEKGRIVAQSREPHHTKEDCIRSISLVKNSRDARVYDG